ncbi:PRD domain-containing protein [Enemella sp. A6]|uniref:PRD domain-containing protein n=1 Tax=Enemella sp. A6 TaxID=3440152 RepID=UPI003EB746A6
MEILRVFNNNLVLARDESGTEVILTGRGLGFNAKPGQIADPSRIVRTFVPSDGRDPDHLAELLAGIPPEQILLVTQAMVAAGAGENLTESATTVIALADHVNFARQRQQAGLEVTYPLQAEVSHLYPEEYDRAERILTELNSRLGDPLPDTEAVAIALHLVNAGFTTGDLSFTYQMTGVIQQLVTVIEETFGMNLETNSVGVGRLITHLRYLFVRIKQHEQLSGNGSIIGDAIRDAYPMAVDCAKRVANLIELRMGSGLSEDEVSYLTLHIANVTRKGEPV